MATQAPRLRQRSGLVDPPGRAGPHLAVYVVPLKDGKLNAKHFTGGRRCFPSYRPTLPRTWASGMVLNAASRAARRSTRRSGVLRPGQPAHQGGAAVGAVGGTPGDRRPASWTRCAVAAIWSSNKGVADRLTEAVQQAYAPVIEKAKQGDLQARRAAEMARQPKPLPATKNGWNRPCRAIRSGLKC